MRRILFLSLSFCGFLACGRPATVPPPAAHHRPARQPKTPPSREVTPAEVRGNFSENGDASYYGVEFAGRATASGELFDPSQMTAAHRTLPLGTRLEVTNLDSGLKVIVRVNDRGPFLKGRILDCSTACAEALGYDMQGTARVGLRVIELGTGKKTPIRTAAIPARPPVIPDPPARPSTPAAPANSFAIQVGAYANRANAETARDKYQAYGMSVYLQEAAGVVRVRLGPYADEAGARAALAKLQGEGLVVREDGP